jgi:uncharacterized membrane protein
MSRSVRSSLVMFPAATWACIARLTAYVIRLTGTTRNAAYP